jgi:hypothetical protein
MGLSERFFGGWIFCFFVFGGDGGKEDASREIIISSGFRCRSFQRKRIN